MSYTKVIFKSATDQHGPAIRAALNTIFDREVRRGSRGVNQNAKLVPKVNQISTTSFTIHPVLGFPTTDEVTEFLSKNASNQTRLKTEDGDDFECEVSEAADVVRFCSMQNPYADEIAAVDGGKAIATALADKVDLKGKERNWLGVEGIGRCPARQETPPHPGPLNNAFGPAGTKPLQKLLSQNTSIQVLRLNNNGLGIDDGRLVAEALILSSKSSLRILDLGRNQFSSIGVAYLASALEALKETLEEVQMPQNSIRPGGVLLLMESLEHLTNLKVLDLQDNTFTESGANAIEATLSNWRYLEHLNVADCLLSARGGINIIKALTPGHEGLQRINLAFGQIDPLGAKFIPEMLRNKGKLESLELNGNMFDPEGEEVERIRGVLREVLKKKDVLDELDEMVWDVDAAGAGANTPTMKANTYIGDLETKLAQVQTDHQKARDNIEALLEEATGRVETLRLQAHRISDGLAVAEKDLVDIRKKL
ncbi:hypothetical protein HK097_006489 [Rhizophlyctis rosea]|uniref:RNI-like protein n=1 Tax=Rhizophlyctis rosea TaxID=64517 RepID=A0AAD5SCV0_9FUNG|nr:hypothetical protein HK097_006489 [Rhizophlyctis rosea]